MAYNKITLNGETKIDLTQDTVTAEDVALGKTFHLNSGESAVGTLEISSEGGEDIMILTKTFNVDNIATDFAEILSLAQAGKLLDLTFNIVSTVNVTINNPRYDRGYATINLSTMEATNNQATSASYPAGFYSFRFNKATTSEISFVGTWLHNTDIIRIKSEGTGYIDSCYTSYNYLKGLMYMYKYESMGILSSAENKEYTIRYFE